MYGELLVVADPNLILLQTSRDKITKTANSCSTRRSKGLTNLTFLREWYTRRWRSSPRYIQCINTIPCNDVSFILSGCAMFYR